MWIEALTRKIGDQRALFRSTYFQWAFAMNGLHVAAERYGSTEWQKLGNGPMPRRASRLLAIVLREGSPAQTTEACNLLLNCAHRVIAATSAVATPEAVTAVDQEARLAAKELVATLERAGRATEAKEWRSRVAGLPN